MRLGIRSTQSSSGNSSPLIAARAPSHRLAAIRAALEAAGVEFTNGSAQPGVRLKKGDDVIRATSDQPPEKDTASRGLPMDSRLGGASIVDLKEAEMSFRYRRRTHIGALRTPLRHRVTAMP